MDNVSAISCFANFSLLLTSQGKVLGMGSNSKGRITGDPSVEHVQQPTLVKDLRDIVKVRAGYFHSLAIDASGQVYSCGGTNKGELGRQSQSAAWTKVDSDETFTDIAAGLGVSFLLSTTKKLYACGKQSLTFNKTTVPKSLKFFKEIQVT